MLHTAIANRTQELSFIRSFRSIPLISLSGYMSFPAHKSLWLQQCSVSLHTASPPHTYTLTVHSLQYTPFTHYFQPLLFPTHRSGKKMRQTSCRQHPSTALRASCVRGTRSTRSGSHTTHRLNTSFRFSTLAFQPCYPRWLKAVFTIRFKPASPTPTPDHPPLRKNAVDIYQEFKIQEFDSTTKNVHKDNSNKMSQ